MRDFDVRVDLKRLQTRGAKEGKKVGSCVQAQASFSCQDHDFG